MLQSFVWISALVCCALAAAEDARDLGYEPFESPGYPEKWQLSTLPGDCGGALKPLLMGLLIGAVVKLPLLLLGKLLLLKAAAPLAIGAALLPLGLYSMYRGSVQQEEAKPESRLLAPSCLLAAACTIGSAAPKPAVTSTAWVLKMVERSLEDGPQQDVAGYREAYLKGASSKSCSAYACPYL